MPVLHGIQNSLALASGKVEPAIGIPYALTNRVPPSSMQLFEYIAANNHVIINVF
jgi:hypothetical protein